MARTSKRGPVPTHWLLIAVPAAALLAFFVLPNALLLSASFVKSEAQQFTAELTLDNYRFLLTRRSISRFSCVRSSSASPSG